MTPPAVEAVRWLIAGRVQGVGFRWFVLRQAESLGLRGWAANLPDGRVEVVAKGSVAQLVQLDAQLRSGPRFASIDTVEKCDIPHEDVEDKSFRIK